MTKTIFYPLLFVLVIAVSLINSNLFGPLSLTAYFGFTIFATFTALLISIHFLFNQNKSIGILLQLPVILLLEMAGYVFLHGYITSTLNVTHYYLIAAVFFFSVVCCYFNNLSHTEFEKTKYFIWQSVLLITLIESLVVLLQYFKALPSLNNNFPCTGSWQNPNVTAMFLAMALWANIQLIQKSKKYHFLLVIPLLAIYLLQCRTAYIITLLFIIGGFGGNILAFLFERISVNKKIVAFLSVLALGILIAYLTLSFKQASTNGRIQIWQNSLGLIKEKPVAGYGFGMFEKYYNLYIADHPSANNDHVFIPYNDFLELAAEGGLIAVALWVFWLLSVFRYSKKNKKDLYPLIAFLIIQLTNFGFQAMPAFALFLLYTGISISSHEIHSIIPEKMKRKYAAYGRLFFAGLAVASGILLVYQIQIAKSFNMASPVTDENSNEIIERYTDITNLSGYQWYHQRFGDAYLQKNEYRPALFQYQLAMERSSEPSLFTKCGLCYQRLHRNDSCEYYYTIQQNMMPYKFMPRMALLNLYQQEGDSVKMYKKAKEILNMPVKVRSKQVDDARAYANKILLTK